MKRLNLGCGVIQPEGWVNADVTWHGNNQIILDVLARDSQSQRFVVEHRDSFDYIVANHMLSDFDHHELPDVLRTMWELLRPGGVTRILVPDLIGAIGAIMNDDANWFPQDERIPDVDERFCTYLTWFGTVKSVFTNRYLCGLGGRAGFRQCTRTQCGDSRHIGEFPHITDLDDRCRQALIVEMLK